MAIEIVDLPSYKMVIFHSYVTSVAELKRRVDEQKQSLLLRTCVSFCPHFVGEMKTLFCGWCNHFG